MKQLEGIKARSPAIKFHRGKGIHLIEEWSKIRGSTFTRQDGVVISNSNIKEYKLKPDILTADWTNALRWDGKHHKIIKLTNFA